MSVIIIQVNSLSGGSVVLTANFRNVGFVEISFCAKDSSIPVVADFRPLIYQVIETWSSPRHYPIPERTLFILAYLHVLV